MDTITAFVLTIVIVVFTVISFFISIEAYKQLREQNVKAIEAIFLSFIYSITCIIQFPHTNNLKISRSDIWKYFWLWLLLVIGVFFIINIWTQNALTLK